MRFSNLFTRSRKGTINIGKGKERAVVDDEEGTCILKEETSQAPAPRRRTSLASLPFDVLYTLMAVSDVSSVHSLSQTCKTIYKVAESPTLWIDLCIGLQRRSRILALDNLVHPFSLHDDIALLKRMVLRTDFLERNWRSPRPRVVQSSLPHPGQPTLFRNQIPVMKILDYGHLANVVFTGPLFISERFWLFSTVFGEIVGWDISSANEEDEEGRILARKLGIFETHIATAVYTFRIDHAERSIYAIICSPHSVTTPDFNVLRIYFPSEEALEEERKLDFSIVAYYRVSNDWQVIKQDVDYARRRICILYQLLGDNALRLHVLLDWDTGAHVGIDTNLYYVAKQSKLDLQFADDGESIHVYMTTSTALVQKSFSITSLRDLQRPATLLLSDGTDVTLTSAPPNGLCYELFLVDEPVPPVCAVTEELDMPAFVSSPHAEFYHHWKLSQSWQRYNLTQHDIDIPTRSSRVFFFYVHPHVQSQHSDPSLTVEEAARQRKEAWHVVQYYTTSERILSRKVFSLQLYDCPTVNLRLGSPCFPIMGASFNHIAWIENVTETVQEIVDSPSGSYNKFPWTRTRTITRTRSRRVLRLLAFPEPGVSPDSEYDVPALPQRPPQMRTLDDIPEDVLDNATHIFLEPAMGAVLVTTASEMHRFNYA